MIYSYAKQYFHAIVLWLGYTQAPHMLSEAFFLYFHIFTFHHVMKYLGIEHVQESSTSLLGKLFDLDGFFAEVENY